MKKDRICKREEEGEGEAHSLDAHVLNVKNIIYVLVIAIDKNVCFIPVYFADFFRKYLTAEFECKQGGNLLSNISL